MGKMRLELPMLERVEARRGEKANSFELMSGPRPFAKMAGALRFLSNMRVLMIDKAINGSETHSAWIMSVRPLPLERPLPHQRVIADAQLWY